MPTRKTGTKKAKGRVPPSAGRSKRPIASQNGLWERISQKAYELWEQRGCQEGNDLRDWLDAEAIVMEELHEARE